MNGLTPYAVLALTFLCVISLVMGVASLRSGHEVRRRIRRALGLDSPSAMTTAKERSPWIETVEKIATPIARLVVPHEGWEGSGLRRRFIQAGLRDPAMPTIYFALKISLAVLLPLAAMFIDRSVGKPSDVSTLTPYLVLTLLVGYYLPNALLDRLLNRRKQDLFETLPDAVDLMTICVESGLSLEAAIARVADEIRMKSGSLSDELQLLSLEFRAGASKERALRNLALRTGIDELDTLVAMLVQSEKFGTSIGQSLRVHSDMMRTKRMQRAEEAAAKVAVKLVVPLVLFIFPCIMIVVGGPALLQIQKALTQFASGG